MKAAIAIVTIALAAELLACGNSSSNRNTNSATGAWTETFSSTSNQALGSMTFNMMQSGATLSGSNMNFSNLGSLTQCFGSGTTLSGQMSGSMMNSGSMTMTMSWTAPGGGTNTLTLQGSMAMGWVRRPARSHSSDRLRGAPVRPGVS